MEKDQRPANEQAETDLQKVLGEATRIKDAYVYSQLSWYKNHANRPMIWFRICGILTIFLSVSLPLLATLEGFWRTLMLPIISLLIAGLTGLNAFYRWESDWKGFRQTQFTIEYRLVEWDLSIAAAKQEKDEKQAIDMVLQATKQLLEATYTLVSTETDQFFQRAQAPQQTQKQSSP